VLTLKWVMRDPRPEDDLTGPTMPCDTIVRQAAKAVLDSDQPVRVMDGDKMVGIVDDEEILRVVVAEEEHEVSPA
jgi:glycine betaine/proline transport system ATP-binding protein